MIGAGMLVPRIEVLRSRTATSRSIRGTICQRANASRLALTVASELAPPAT